MGMAEAIALIATATWLLTAVIKGVAARWVQLSGPDAQAVSLLVALGFTVGGYYTGFIVGNPVEIVLMLIVGMFGANLFHDKIEVPTRAILKL